MKKVVVGMSGGVDSAVAAYLLKKQGYEVIGVMLRTWDSTAEEWQEGESTGFEVVQNKCCEIDDASDVAKMLGIEFHAFNAVSDFRNHVVEPFICEYACARTPNPCIECNRYVKFEKLLYFANVLGADYIATGHYAKKVKLPNGRYTVQKSDAAKKDQTYMLYKLTQEELERVLFPLGDYEKPQIREIAKEAGIPVAEKKDSQEICFIPDDDYAKFVKKHISCITNKFDTMSDNMVFNNDTGFVVGSEESTSKNYQNAFKEGDFVDKDGNVLGRHNGLIHYTIGQRKGLGLSMGHPVYVCRLDAHHNRVVIGDEEDLYTDKVKIRDYNFLSIPEPTIGDSLRANVKVRYHHPGENAEIKRISEDKLLLTFEKPVKSATPGQSAVFYDDNMYVIGGGIIC
ncbi:MAG: tRNA 2-thiouridine(34) synthase MnmA [Lachnospiraceae bacterium]|nr:tRNA 2-thiouridine(34) synthase MnmA [Lachnospiraceae bacterium]